MVDRLSSLRAWTTFAGWMLVVAVLHWAQAIFVPLCLAILLTFVLTPPVIWLQRRIGRVAAVLVVVTLVFSGLGLAGWGMTRQMSSLSTDLITYRANIRQKVRDVRGVQHGGSVEKLQSTFDQIKKDMGVETAPRSAPSQPVVVSGDPLSGFPAFGWMGSFVGPAGTAGFVIVLVLFMLLEREELRDRLIGLIGHGHLATTTKAFDEAGRRVSRQLLLQTLVNAIYGGIAAVGLWMFGAPYPLFWGAAGAALRFIPYIGPVVASAGPILISLAALPGWTRPLEVAGFYVLLELFTNLVLETVLYAGAAGISQVSLLVSVAFWTWLWGPLGLLMATPLTVCLVVLGKHVPGLSFVATLLSDRPALAPEYGYYQRLLARDVAEAADLVERFAKTEPAETVYDALLVPALNYAERDRLEDHLSEDDEQAIIDGTRELMNDGPLAPTPIEDVVDASTEDAQPSEPSSSGRISDAGAGVCGQRGGRRPRARNAVASADRSPDRVRAAWGADSRFGFGQVGRSAGLQRCVHCRPSSERAVEDALSRAPPPRCISRSPHPGRPMGTSRAGRRHPAADSGGRSHPCLDDAARDEAPAGGARASRHATRTRPRARCMNRSQNSRSQR